jgi:hypothetical protein
MTDALPDGCATCSAFRRCSPATPFRQDFDSVFFEGSSYQLFTAILRVCLFYFHGPALFKVSWKDASACAPRKPSMHKKHQRNSLQNVTRSYGGMTKCDELSCAVPRRVSMCVCVRAEANARRTHTE